MSREGITLHVNGRDIFIPSDLFASARVVGWDLKTTTEPGVEFRDAYGHPEAVQVRPAKTTGKLQITLEFDLEGDGITESAVIADELLPSPLRPQLPAAKPLLRSP